jgi:hypothetical protein
MRTILALRCALVRDRIAAGMRRRSPHGQRGDAAVEFALVSLLLFTLVFGIIEFSLVMRDKIAVTSAARAGGRLASAEPRAPGYADPITNTGTAVTGLVPDAVKAVAASLTGIPKASIKAIWVYQANANGLPANGNALPSGGNGGSCSTNCVSYRYDPLRTWVDSTGATITGGFTLTGGSWPASAINACPADPNAQSVGIYVQVTHTFITGSFVTGAPTLDLSDTATFKFEPIPTSPGPCK